MKFSFYVIDDLRLGHDPQSITSLKRGCFSDLREALAHYRSLSKDSVKELGMADDLQLIRLVRRVPLFPWEPPREDVLITNQLALPVWRRHPEVCAAARDCVSALKIRYCLDHARIIPSPLPLPAELLEQSYGPPVVRRAYTVGFGWLTTADLHRRFQQEEGCFCYPMILKYQVDVQTGDAVPATLEVTPWELCYLESRAGICVTPK